MFPGCSFEFPYPSPLPPAHPPYPTQLLAFYFLFSRPFWLGLFLVPPRGETFVFLSNLWDFYCARDCKEADKIIRNNKGNEGVRLYFSPEVWPVRHTEVWRWYFSIKIPFFPLSLALQVFRSFWICAKYSFKWGYFSVIWILVHPSFFCFLC